MMMKFAICAMALLLVAGAASGQQDSIRRVIEEYPFGRSALVAKGRHLLIDKFTEGDYTLVKDVVDYFDREFEDSTIQVLYPKERLLLYYWTGDYSKILGPDGQYREAVRETGHYRYPDLEAAGPLRDGLERLLEKRTTEQRLELCQRIDSTGFTSEGKDFLKLNLLWMLTWEWDTTDIRGEVNALADTFLANHRTSQYAGFVKEHIRFVYRPSNRGIGWELFAGYGSFTGRLHDNFGHVIPVGCAGDLYYRRCELFLGGFMGFSSTHRTIPYASGQWLTGSRAYVDFAELALGYQAIDNQHIVWTPFAGVAATDISPPQDDLDHKPGYKDCELKHTTTYTLGCNFDIKINHSIGPIVAYHENSYWFLRIRYSYIMPEFAHKYPNSNGNMHLITIGIGVFGRALQRVMQ